VSWGKTEVKGNEVESGNRNVNIKRRETHISHETRHVHIETSKCGLHAVDHCGPIGHNEAK
jgi:hypothetical protein